MKRNVLNLLTPLLAGIYVFPLLSVEAPSIEPRWCQNLTSREAAVSERYYQRKQKIEDYRVIQDQNAKNRRELNDNKVQNQRAAKDTALESEMEYLLKLAGNNEIKRAAVLKFKKETIAVRTELYSAFDDARRSFINEQEHVFKTYRNAIDAAHKTRQTALGIELAKAKAQCGTQLENRQMLRLNLDAARKNFSEAMAKARQEKETALKLALEKRDTSMAVAKQKGKQIISGAYKNLLSVLGS